MKILTRYVLREHAGPFIAALGVLTGLMLLNQLARRFADLVGKGLPWHMIVQVFGLSIPFIIAMTMPMAVLVAVLYSFSRLSSDNEVTAFKAGGISLLRLMRPVLVAATVLAAAMVLFNDKVLPESNHALRQLLTDIGRKQPTFELRERVINQVVPGKLFLQAARIDRVRSVLRDLVIFDLGRPGSQRTIYADSGQMAFNRTQTDLYLTLYDGSMHERDAQDPGTDQRTYYAKQVIRVAGVSNELQRGQGVSWRGDREMNISMMQDEILSRRERLAEIGDSLNLIIAGLSLLSDSAPSSSERPALADRSEEPISLSDDEGGDIRARRGAPTSRAADETRETVEAGSTGKASQRRIRKILSPLRRPSWPPTGDAAAYAARYRAEFQRQASRVELHRREISRFAVEIHKKISIPAAAIVFVLLGAPIGTRFPRGGIGMVIGVSLAVFCVYYISLIGGEDLADRSIISPFWAMWAPNVLFAGVGAFLLYLVTRGKLPRRRRAPEGTTGRPTSDTEVMPRGIAESTT